MSTATLPPITSTLTPLQRDRNERCRQQLLRRLAAERDTRTTAGLDQLTRRARRGGAA